MTTEVLIKNLGPATVSIETVTPNGTHQFDKRDLSPDAELSAYVHATQVIRVVEGLEPEKPAAG